MKKEEGWIMKDEGFKLLRGFEDEHTFVNVELLSQLKTLW